MAQIDDQHLQITLGIVGVGDAPVDMLIHQGRKLGLDRELLEAVPVVRFGLRAEVLGRPLVVVMSAAPLDVVQADAVIAVHSGDPELENLLDLFDLLPIEEAELTMERLAGAGRACEPLKLLMNAGAPPLPLEGFDAVEVDLETGNGISAAINPIVSRVASLLESGEWVARECPTIVLHATHRATSDEDLSPSTFPRPGARIALNVSLHEPFGDEDDSAWSCAFEGTVDGVTGPHTVQGTVEPAGEVPAVLEGRWAIELIREREIWMLRSMARGA
jgi:hypothetical protein